jgi:hypothetical protein
MKLTIKAIILAFGFMTVLVVIGFFGVKWSTANLHNEEIMRLKPWQPMARLALTVVTITLTCIFGGALIKVTSRDL